MRKPSPLTKRIIKILTEEVYKGNRVRLRDDLYARIRKHVPAYRGLRKDEVEPMIRQGYLDALAATVRATRFDPTGRLGWPTLQKLYSFIREDLYHVGPLIKMTLDEVRGIAKEHRDHGVGLTLHADELEQYAQTREATGETSPMNPSKPADEPDAAA
jgi:hypothetical protein